MSVIKQARARQRRRRRAIAVVLLASGIGALVFALAGRGTGQPGPRAAEPRPAAHRVVRVDSGRAFAKYGLSCDALRAAALSIGPRTDRWCRPGWPTPVQTRIPQVVSFVPAFSLPRASCEALRKVGIAVEADKNTQCEFRFAVPSRRA